MKSLTTSCLLASLFALSVLAETDAPASATISYPSTTATTSVITDSPTLELRQVNLVDPDAALTAITGVGDVTNYNINSQIAKGTGVNIAVVYTQTFAKVPDQWPSAKPGVIGMGDLKRRDLEAVPTLVEEAQVAQQTGYMMQPLVIEAVTEVVTVKVRRATSIVVIETAGVGHAGNGSIATDGTGIAGNGTAYGTGTAGAASTGLGSLPLLHTATRQ